MAKHLNFRLSDELSERFSTYCFENKLTTTEAMNRAVQKLIANKQEESMQPVIDRTYVLLNSLYRFILKYTKTTLPDIETKSALAKLSEKAHSDLDKLKNKKG